MDTWKYRRIAHRDHLVCNPTSESKLDELVALLDLPAGARVLDIACGKAELLCRIAERYGASGIGVDISPYEVETARNRVQERGLAGRVEIVQLDGAEYRADDASFDQAMCIGATWVWDGLNGTLDALSRWTRPGGLVVVGEAFWLRSPTPEYLAFTGMTAGMFGSHAENVAAGEAAGLALLYSVVSNPDDWDRYEGLQWRASESYAIECPDDPDVPELRERARDGREEYLRWGRDTLNWAMYLFRKAG